jgi:anti-sigma B factor antagonist
MQLECVTYSEVMVIRVDETRIDAAGAIEFKEQMREYLGVADRRVMLDLSRVTFIDSSGLGAVVAVRKSLGPDRMLELANLTPAVERVFRLTRMDSIFPIHVTLPSGLRDAI